MEKKPWVRGVITPTTVKGTLPMRMVWPMGERPDSPKRSSMATSPSTATRARLATSSAVKKRPSATAQLSCSMYSGVVPGGGGLPPPRDGEAAAGLRGEAPDAGELGLLELPQ